MADGPGVAASPGADTGQSVHAGGDGLLGESHRGHVMEYHAAPVMDAPRQCGRIALCRDDDLDAIARTQRQVGSELMLVEGRGQIDRDRPYPGGRMVLCVRVELAADTT